MFLTRDNAEISLEASISTGARSWRFVEWHQTKPWFWVTVMIEGDGYSHLDTLMLCLPSDIANLIAEGVNASKVVEVQIVTPPSMNKTEVWSMEPLTEIVRGVVPRSGRTVHVFKCRNGKMYVEDSVQPSLPELLSQELIFSEMNLCRVVYWNSGLSKRKSSERAGARMRLLSAMHEQTTQNSAL